MPNGNSFLTLTLMATALTPAFAAMSASLQPSVASPAPLGSVITWTASTSGASPGVLWYRFRAHSIDEPFHIVRDYGPVSTLDWTAADYEGSYEVELSVRNRNTGDIATTSAVYQMTPRVSGDSSVISPTSHPLVFLYSAPPCTAGSRMRVRFQAAENVVQRTPYKQCSDSHSMNFYLAGMHPNLSYSAETLVNAGSGAVAGTQIESNVADLSMQLNLPQFIAQQTPPEMAAEPVILHSTLNGTPIATDLLGNLVWFYPNYLSLLTRPEPGGLFLGLIEDQSADQSGQIVREFDLAGITVAETNAARVNEQLAALGKRQISAFHHEARLLPGGNLLVLATVEQILTDVQGPGDIDVLGDMIVVMDRDLQVVWTWDAFDHLDTARSAILGETCTIAGAGCPPFYKADVANDWLHGNSVQQTPDGNLLYSTRHQDWLIKIDYSNGAGSGNVIWRLGREGDFVFNSSDSFPWFSHQHDGQFLPDAQTTLTIFDNGNTRHFLYPDANSRGMVLQLDENALTATPLLSADLGVYSAALGAAQKLSSGDYYFLAGILSDNSALMTELDPSGTPVYSLRSTGPEYRSFRMRDLYTSPY